MRTFSCEQAADRFHHAPALILQRREVTPQPAELFRTCLRAEAPRDLLLHFEHPQVTLRLIIIEGYGQVLHEEQERLLGLTGAYLRSRALPA